MVLSFELLGALDDRHQVDPGGLVDLDQPLVAVLLAVLDQLLGARKLLAMRRQERLIGEERRAGQARVRVRTGLLQRQPAVAVRQGLLGTRDLLLGQAASESSPSIS